MSNQPIPDPRPILDDPCPRCGDKSMRGPVTTNALSRTTRGESDDPIWVCSACGRDEAMEDAFALGATHPNFWPMDRKYDKIFTFDWDDAPDVA